MVKRANAKGGSSATFQPYRKIGEYDVVLHKNGTYYVAWYDRATRQVRRRSLTTISPSEAVETVERLVRDSTSGDPKAALAASTVATVADALDYYIEHRVEIRSTEAARISAKHLKVEIGAIPVGLVNEHSFKRFGATMTARGYSVGYVSRILSVMRAALNRCERDGKIQRAPHVIEIRTKAKMEAAPLRGRVMSCEEIAWLIDCNVESHLLAYLMAEINTAARMEAVLESFEQQIDWGYGLIDLNPAGREQTKKHRPILPITATWRPWLERLPKAAPLVSYDGRPVKSVKTGVQQLVMKSKLTGTINSTSIRHSIGRWFSGHGVADREKSIWLGHVPVSRNPTTARYSPEDPFHPDYLKQATAAIEAFVREINRHTRKWDLERPYTVKPGWKRGA